MNNQQNLPRRMLVTLAVISGTIGLSAGSSYAAVPTSVVAPSETAVATAEPTVSDSNGGCGGGEIVSDAAFASDFEGLSEAERSGLVEEMSADAASLMAQLDAKGIAYTTEAEPVTGVAWPVFGPDDAAAVAVFESQDFSYELGVGDDAFAEDFAALDDTERSAIVEQMKDDAASVAAQFDAAGVSYTTSPDPVTGVEFPIPDDGAATDGLDLHEFVYSF